MLLLCVQAAGLGARKQNKTAHILQGGAINTDRSSSEKRKCFLPNHYIHKFWMSIKLCSFTLNAFQTECCFPECASHSNISKTAWMSRSCCPSSIVLFSCNGSRWWEVVLMRLRSSSPLSPSSSLICVSSNCVPCTAFQWGWVQKIHQYEVSNWGLDVPFKWLLISLSHNMG